MMIKAVTVSASEDLRPLVGLLRSQHIPHHITEESGQLVVWAPDEGRAALIASLYRAWHQGELDLPGSAAMPQQPILPLKGLLQNLLSATWAAPLTITLIVACAIVAAISKLGADTYAVRALFFPSVPATGLAGLISNLNSAGLWLQTLTPALLHFGAIHLVFNMLWLWYLGKLMEPVLGWWRYALVIVLSAFCGNVLQFLWSGTINFGGMSGVVYGQIGFIWLWQNVSGERRLRLPLAMIMVFLAALLLMEILASAYIATAAHIGGLAAGMLLGALLGFGYRSTNQRSR